MTTSVETIANGTQTVFTYNFPSIQLAHIAVYLDGAPQTEGYTQSVGSITFTVAPTVGTVVRIQRITHSAGQLTEYNSGTTLTASELQIDSLQALFLIQEEMDRASEAEDDLGLVIATKADQSYAEDYADNSSANALDQATAYVDGVAVALLAGANAYTDTEVATLDAAKLDIADLESHLVDLGSDSAQLVFQPEGTGATARTVAAKLRDTVSVKDFGAKGDGATDDAPAFQAAADYMESAGGGTVLVPRGTYLLSTATQRTIMHEASPSSPLEATVWTANLWLPAGVSLKGENRPRLVSGGGVQGIVVVVDWSNASIDNLEIEGVGSTNNAAHGVLTTMTGTSHLARDIAFRNLYVHDVGSYGIGHQYGGVDGLAYQNIHVRNTGADGIDHKVRFAPPAEIGQGYYQSKGVTFDNIHVQNHGLRLGTNSGVDVRGVATLNNIQVTDFGFPGSALYGITFSGGLHHSLSGNVTQPSARSSLSNFFVKANSPNVAESGDTTGVNCLSGGPLVISNGYVQWCQRGVWTREATATPSAWKQGPSLSNVTVDGSRGMGGSFLAQQERTKLAGCTTLSDIQYFDEKRANLEANQTTFIPVGGVDIGALGVKVYKNDVLLTGSGVDYAVSGADIVLTTPAVITDTINIVTPAFRAVRVEGSNCSIIGHDFDAHCLTGISVTAGGAEGIMRVANRALNTRLDTADPVGTLQLIARDDVSTDADITLIPQGGGKVRLGGSPHNPTADVAITGYIEIKDNGGVIRKLAVIT